LLYSRSNISNNILPLQRRYKTITKDNDSAKGIVTSKAIASWKRDANPLPRSKVPGCAKVTMGITATAEANTMQGVNENIQRSSSTNEVIGTSTTEVHDDVLQTNQDPSSATDNDANTSFEDAMMDEFLEETKTPMKSNKQDNRKTNTMEVEQEGLDHLMKLLNAHNNDVAEIGRKASATNRRGAVATETDKDVEISSTQASAPHRGGAAATETDKDVGKSPTQASAPHRRGAAATEIDSDVGVPTKATPNQRNNEDQKENISNMEESDDDDNYDLKAIIKGQRKDSNGEESSNSSGDSSQRHKSKTDAARSNKTGPSRDSKSG
jgi:hypothetical protein